VPGKSLAALHRRPMHTLLIQGVCYGDNPKAAWAVASNGAPQGHGTSLQVI
jgi:hypothetical protein